MSALCCAEKIISVPDLLSYKEVILNRSTYELCYGGSTQTLSGKRIPDNGNDDAAAAHDYFYRAIYDAYMGLGCKC